jgi:prephenate dehydratase
MLRYGNRQLLMGDYIKKSMKEISIMKIDKIQDQLISQKDKLFEFIKKHNYIKISTLGPSGTSSWVSTKYFIDCLLEFFNNETYRFSLELYDDFDDVINHLINRKADMIVVPNAYEKIKDLYWDLRLNYIFTYIYDTPQYGLAAKYPYDFDQDRIYRIASCPAVFTLIEQLIPGIQHTIIEVSSTSMAAKYVCDDMADLAVTNETSAKIHELNFVTQTFKAGIPWSVFVFNETESSNPT